VSGSLPNLIGPLTGPISGDEYVRVVLVRRQEAWIAAHETSRGFPPLLEWFIEPGDEEFVQLPEAVEKPSSKDAPKPRQYRSAESLRAERDGLLRRMEQVAGRGDLGDRAAVNLSPYARSRAARTAGRRRFAQMDRDLETYTKLKRRLDVLNSRIARAEAREDAA
jgi:hypothetical protein